jgi:hypothetical protein
VVEGGGCDVLEATVVLRMVGGRQRVLLVATDIFVVACEVEVQVACGC